MKKIKYISLLSLIILSGCSIDKKPPTLELHNTIITRGFEMDEATVIDKMVVSIDDNRKLTRENPIDVVNYNDLDFNTSGDYNVIFRAIDDSNNFEDYNATLTVKPTQADLDKSEFEETVAEYKKTIKVMKNCELASKSVIKNLTKQVNNLNQATYLNFKPTLDEEYNALVKKYQGTMLVTEFEIVEQINRGLELEPENIKLNDYLKEIDELDLKSDDLEVLAKSYEQLNKINDEAISYILTLQRETTSIPDEVYNNVFKSEGTCSKGSGRQKNVIVNIGAGDRTYHAYTNGFGQIVYIEAKEVIIRDSEKDNLDENGSYCAEIPQVFGSDQQGLTATRILGEGIGGASNAYNVIPTNKGPQLQEIEENIVTNGGATDLKIYLTYDSSDSYSPSSMRISYKINNRMKSKTI